MPLSVESLLTAVLPNASERKLRLFACACARCFWDDFDHPRSRLAIEATERFADGLASEKEHRLASESAAHVARNGATRHGLLRDLARDASQPKIRRSVVDAVRCAQRVAFFDEANTDKPCGAIRPGQRRLEERLISYFQDVFADAFTTVSPPGAALLAQNDHAALRVAQAIYEERDFTRLPILADALEDAGCTDDAVLGHCRGGGPHVRGCWVVDLILGRQ